MLAQKISQIETLKLTSRAMLLHNEIAALADKDPLGKLTRIKELLQVRAQLAGAVSAAPAPVLPSAGFTKTSDGRTVSNRTVYIPNLSKSKLERLLAKPKLSKDDIEDLLDYKWLMLFDKQAAQEKGLMDVYRQSGSGDALIPKNKYWLANIDSAIAKNGGNPQEMTNNHLAVTEANLGVQDKDGKSVSPEDDVQALGDNENGLNDDHLSEDYRYKDVGYIAGSRKELAAESLSRIIKSGEVVRPSDVDWDVLDADNRLAESILTKKNMLGKVNWQALKDGGMQAKAGFVISKLYAAIEPKFNEALGTSKHYVTAIANLRDDMESCKTLDEVRVRVMLLAAGFWELRKRGTQVLEESYETQVNICMGKKFMYVALNIDNNSGDVVKAVSRLSDDDWSWARLKPADTGEVAPDAGADGTPKKERKKTFSLEASKTIERVGGAPVTVESTEQFKSLFGLKAVQSGKWVLADVESAKFHVEQAAGAFVDMADVTGIPVASLGLGGRLGLAFGARGHGAALAHYEPVQRVINITKMKGGGSLGHEYFHAIDNMMVDLVHQKNNGKADFFASDNADALPDGAIAQAYAALNGAMLKGDVPQKKWFKISDKDRLLSRQNFNKHVTGGLAFDIMNAGSLDAAIGVIDAKFDAKFLKHNRSKERSKGWDGFIRAAGAFYLGDGVSVFEAVDISLATEFYNQALALDNGAKGKYWSKPYEMAARAFSAYLEDKLAKDGRKNTYLASPSDDERAYPQGEERVRINAAFDVVFKELKNAQVFENALNNNALMDSLFGDFEQELLNDGMLS
jgi:hypothetical protein